MKKIFLILFSLLTINYSLFTLAPSIHAQVVGSITNPLTGTYATGTQGQGLFVFISNVFKLAGTIAGIYMIFQFIVAGYSYISSAGDPKAAAAAWAQIWQSILGMVIIASAFIIAAVVGRFTGIDIINPIIYGP